jgi:multicomponent Na+:H+ antiporter subunit D
VNDFLSVIPVIMLLLSLGAALLIFPMPEHANRLRSTVNIGLAVIKVGLVAMLFPLVLVEGINPEVTLPFVPGLELVLRVEPLSLLFAALSSVLWLITTVYALGYLAGKPNQSRFFGFFSLCVTATVGISFSGNLITFLVFYEMLTLVTYPLVAHWGSPEALKAARTYLRYTMTGGLSLLVGVIWLTVYAGQADFQAGGAEGVDVLAAESPNIAIIIFILLIAGVGVKAALVPLHGWLPLAMVAPAPVSALLHAVAVVKAGVFGIVRIVDDVYGIETSRELGLLQPLLIIASVTIVYGSYQALRHTDIKERLAYSTVSQVSYVVLGLSLTTVAGTTGGLVHLVHQGMMKITLFFCAGLFKETVGVDDVRDTRGLGYRMPWSATAFTVGALGMIGIPPTAGFISKWQLGIGALDSENTWVLGILLISSLMNSMYFLPIVYRMWFFQPDHVEPQAVTEPKTMLLPALVTTGFVLAMGIGASIPFAPLEIAEQISEGVFADVD